MGNSPSAFLYSQQGAPLPALEPPGVTKVADPAPGYRSINLFLPLPQDKTGCCRQSQAGSFSLAVPTPQTHGVGDAPGYTGLKPLLPKSEPLGSAHLAMRFIQSPCSSPSHIYNLRSPSFEYFKPQHSHTNGKHSWRRFGLDGALLVSLKAEGRGSNSQ